MGKWWYGKITAGSKAFFHECHVLFVGCNENGRIIFFSHFRFMHCRLCLKKFTDLHGQVAYKAICPLPSVISKQNNLIVTSWSTSCYIQQHRLMIPPPLSVGQGGVVILLITFPGEISDVLSCFGKSSAICGNSISDVRVLQGTPQFWGWAVRRR